MRRVLVTIATCLLVAVAIAGQAPTGRTGGSLQPPPDPTVVGRTPEGFALRLAIKTGHITNYSESMARPYEVPDPLVMADGRPRTITGSSAVASSSGWVAGTTQTGATL